MYKLRSKVLLVLLFLCLPLLACKERGEAASPVLVRVDHRTVTLAQFRKEFAKTLPAGQELTADEKGELERAFLVQLIDRALTLAEAERLHIQVTPAELEKAIQGYREEYPDHSLDAVLKERGLSLAEWRQEVEEGLLMEKVMRQAVDARIAVSRQEIEHYYREHSDQFNRPEQVRARQIVVGSEEEGQRILGLLRQGPPSPRWPRNIPFPRTRSRAGTLASSPAAKCPPSSTGWSSPWRRGGSATWSTVSTATTFFWSKSVVRPSTSASTRPATRSGRNFWRPSRKRPTNPGCRDCAAGPRSK